MKKTKLFLVVASSFALSACTLEGAVGKAIDIIKTGVDWVSDKYEEIKSIYRMNYIICIFIIS